MRSAILPGKPQEMGATSHAGEKGNPAITFASEKLNEGAQDSAKAMEAVAKPLANRSTDLKSSKSATSNEAAVFGRRTPEIPVSKETQKLIHSCAESLKNLPLSAIRNLPIFSTRLPIILDLKTRNKIFAPILNYPSVFDSNFQLGDPNFRDIPKPRSVGDVDFPEGGAGKDLRKFAQLVGRGICAADDPQTYKQILPEKIFLGASEVYNKLNSEERTKFADLLNHYANKGESPLDGASRLLAISTIFGALAYGEDFAKRFIAAAMPDSALRSSLDHSKKYFAVQQNFIQNYLNTCAAVSAFTVLSTAFSGNIEMLKLAIEHELGKVSRQLPSPEGSNPAYKSHSWRKAPTINEERERRTSQCETALKSIPNESYKLSHETMEAQQKELLRAFERLTALQSSKPTLLSMRALKELSEACVGNGEFITSCILNLTGNALAKALTLGTYVSSLDLSERLNGVALPKNTFTARPVKADDRPVRSDFENENPGDVWERSFRYGTTPESRSNGSHAVTVKAAVDGEGHKFLIVCDPIKRKPETMALSAD